MFGCLAFYTTESWGLAMMQTGFSTFFSGALVPLSIMPLWLRQATLSMPFAQAIYVPISVLSRITPTHDLPRLLLHQLLWLCGLLIASRLVFRIAVRKVTVQGG
jgi:ABC-2 type transport system permease protein